MTDTRVTHRNKELAIDDDDYLVKLLSKLPIVKWMPPKSLGFVTNPNQVNNQLLSDDDHQVDYVDLEIQKFIPGLFPPEFSLPAGIVGENPTINSTPKYSKQVLNLLFPPQEWIEKNGEKFQQEISPCPSTRLDNAVLKDKIQSLMLQAQARPTGICPIRENLVHRCFDEMIRLTTIDSGDRGLLMQTVQDDIRMTLTCYKSLLESAVEFGSRKFHQTLAILEELHQQLDTLTRDKERYQHENQEMRLKMRHMDRKDMEERQAIVESRKHKLTHLRRTNSQFIAMLDMIGVDKNLYRHLI